MNEEARTKRQSPKMSFPFFITAPRPTLDKSKLQMCRVSSPRLLAPSGTLGSAPTACEFFRDQQKGLRSEYKITDSQM